MPSTKTNRQLLSRGTDVYARKKQKKSVGVEHVEFNPEDRAEYLTGFHKRKMKRKEMAAEASAKRAKQEHLEERKSVSLINFMFIQYTLLTFSNNLFIY